MGSARRDKNRNRHSPSPSGTEVTESPPLRAKAEKDGQKEKGGIHLTQVALHVVLSVNYLSIWQRRGMGGLLDSTNLMSILAAGGLPPAPKTEDRSTLDPLVGGP
mgnify:CR=1 FL=1